MNKKDLKDDATVIIDGDTVITEDRFGNVIYSGIAGKDDVEAVQAAIDSLPNGGGVAMGGEFLCSGRTPLFNEEENND